MELEEAWNLHALPGEVIPRPARIVARKAMQSFLPMKSMMKERRKVQ